MEIIWTDYMKYRLNLRKFNIKLVTEILKHTSERYYDITSHRKIAIGRHENALVLIPYEQEGERVTPITVHATTRQQISFRLRTGRYINE
jgi:hypothetical protein